MLIGILFSVLFNFLKDLGFHQLKISRDKKSFEKEHYFHVKMSQAFNRIVFKGDEKKKRKFCTETSEESKSLLFKFTFNNGKTPIVDLCNEVEGRFFLNRNQEVIFEIYSLKNEEVKKSECLLTQVEKMEFLFFDPRDDKKRWVSSWPETIKELPPMMKLELHFKGGKELSYAFFFGRNDFISIGS